MTNTTCEAQYTLLVLHNAQRAGTLYYLIYDITWAEYFATCTVYLHHVYPYTLGILHFWHIAQRGYFKGQ